MRVARLLRWLYSLPHDPGWLRLLLAVNLAGAVYGFRWYAPQLAATPTYLWPVVPDSPLSALLFALGLLPRLHGGDDRAPRWIALARLATFKYGLWTVLVLGGATLRSGSLDPEAALLFLTHAGMAAEAWLLLRAAPPAPGAAAVALAALLVNDAFDYGPLRTHPALPDPAALPYVAAEAAALSLLAFALARAAAAAARGRGAGDRQAGGRHRDHRREKG